MEFDDLLRRAENALIDLDAEALVACYAPEFIFEDIASEKQISNSSELSEYFNHLFSSPEVLFKDVQFFNLGGRAAGQWTWCGRSQSGVKFSIQGASLFKLGNDGIKEKIIFYDPRPSDA